MSSFRVGRAAAIGGVTAFIGPGMPAVLAHQGTGTRPGVAGAVQSLDGSSTGGSCGSPSGTRLNGAA
ncbi:MAG: hypothetical protein WAO09_02775 [Candidatus Dormiibacterota bacterium]